jgi:hypothetical protein
MAGSRAFRCVVILSLAHSRSFGQPPCPVLSSVSLPSLSAPSSRSLQLLFPEPAAEAASSSTVPATLAVAASEAEPLTEVLHATMYGLNHGQETFLVLRKAAIAGVEGEDEAKPAAAAGGFGRRLLASIVLPISFFAVIS